MNPLRTATTFLAGALLAACVACSSDDSSSAGASGGAGGAGGAGGSAGGAGGAGGSSAGSGGAGAAAGAGGTGGSAAAGGGGGSGGTGGATCDGGLCSLPCVVEDCSSGPCSPKFDVDACDYTVATDPKRRIGLYAWGFAPAPAKGAELLSWGADRVAEAGSRAIRVYLGPANSYGVNPSGNFTLLAAAKSPAYAKLFGDPRFDTIWITAYSVADNAITFVDGYDSTEIAAERAEIAALGQHLLATHPGKTFVISNWEGDNQLTGQVSDLAWQGFTDWISSRAAGVADAVLASPASSSRLYSALEFNRIAKCGAERCVISHVAPKVAVGFYAYSSYESINQDDAAAVGPSLKQGLSAALAFVQATRPKVGKERFVVGELGFAREVPYLGECEAASRAMLAVDALQSWGAAGAFWWQIADNPLEFGFWAGFGLLKNNGSKSRTHAAFSALYATGVPGAPSTLGCPRINSGGVVSAVTHTAVIHKGDALEIYGTGLSSGTGSVAFLRQGVNDMPVSAGSPAFYESASQVNLTLPSAVNTGAAMLWLRRADGLDTNGQLLDVLP